MLRVDAICNLESIYPFPRAGSLRNVSFTLKDWEAAGEAWWGGEEIKFVSRVRLPLTANG